MPSESMAEVVVLALADEGKNLDEASGGLCCCPLTGGVVVVHTSESIRVAAELPLPLPPLNIWLPAL